jgi:hypothetical protein
MKTEPKTRPANESLADESLRDRGEKTPLFHVRTRKGFRCYRNGKLVSIQERS